MAINLKDTTTKSIKQNIIAFPAVPDSSMNSGYGILLFDANNSNVSCNIKDIRAKLLDNSVSGAKVSLHANDGTNFFSIAKNIPVNNTGGLYVGQTVSLIDESTGIWLSNASGEIQRLYAEVNSAGKGKTHFEVDYELFWQNSANPPTLNHSQRYVQSQIETTAPSSFTLELFESQKVSGSYSWSLSGTTSNISPTSGTVTFTNGHASINFTTSAVSSDEVCTFATSGNEFTSTITLKYSPGSVTVDSTPVGIGQNTQITYASNSRNGTITITGTVTVDLEAQGGAGGRGMWSGNNDPGGPGGQVIARYTLTAGTYYYFVGEGNKSVSGKAGAGGGSTDVRTTYSNGSTFDRTAFLNTNSLNSRIIVAGGGGGPHGGTYGYWGYSGTNSPGAGGPTTTNTNSRGTNDGGYVATGASTSAAGQDGGASTSTQYTASGQFGHGGIQSAPLQTLSYSSTTNYSGWGWPNGGAGTTYSNGGGGGGWYGGATNWPNGGGGSNYVQSSGGATLVSTTTNAGEVQTGVGFLKVTRVA